MNDAGARRWPRTVRIGDAELAIRYMQPADADAVLAFARELPTHDLLFLPRDITHPKVLEAWVRELERATLISLLAVRDGTVLGCATVVRDALSWSPHVAELRVVVSASARGKGLGRILMQDAFAIALSFDSEKIVAHMTVDQAAAIAAFESMGYRAEALLRDFVKDRDGVKHDVVVLCHDVAQANVRDDVYGLTEAFADTSPASSGSED